MSDEYNIGSTDTLLTVRAWLKGNPMMLFGDDRNVMWSWCLGHNLAVAGGLCRAFALGAQAQRYADGDDDESYWMPGAGTEATP